MATQRGHQFALGSRRGRRRPVITLLPALRGTPPDHTLTFFASNLFAGRRCCAYARAI